MHTLLVGQWDWYWDWISASVLLVVVAFAFANKRSASGPSTIREETIGQIIDSLPESLSVGTQSPSEVLQSGTSGVGRVRNHDAYPRSHFGGGHIGVLAERRSSCWSISAHRI